MTETTRIPIEAARDFSERVLRGVGVTAEHARMTVASLIYADQRGTASHGLLRLPLYADAVRQGGINVAPELRWVSDHGSGALLDADGAFGQVAMHAAVDYARRHLERHATVTVAVQNSSHFGAGSFWSDMLTRDGHLAIVTSTTGPTVAPFGGTDKVLGTNPLTIGLPSPDGSGLTADMATSTGAYGKVIAARDAGTELPDGWALDADGRATRDPVAAMAGSLTAFGGHKGSAVAVALEGLAASLGDATFAFETEDIWANPSSRMNVGHTLIAINPAFFAGAEHTAGRVDTLRDRVRASAADRPVLAPSDPELHHLAEHEGHLDLGDATLAKLDASADSLGLDRLSR